MDYTTTFSNLYAVLKAASSKCKVIDEKFPSEFFERDPKMIFTAYTKFLKSRTDAAGNLKDEDKIPFTTIADRFEQGEYAKKENGLYMLYHDMKLVCTLLIHFYSQGTRNYQMVDKFYKFATELLLRECYRLGVMLLDDEMEQYSEEKTAFYKNVSHDFIKISVGYSVPYAETYYISSGDIDLFSSTISKAQLDERTTELPNNNFVLNKVIPRNGDNTANRLGFLAANISNIPDPTLPPTEMMTKFLHPNWYALPTTVWLEYGDYKSWAPCFNESGTVLDAARRGIIWLEKIGYVNLWKMRGHKDEENGSNEKDEMDQKEVDTNHIKHVDDIKVDQGDEENGDVNHEADNSSNGKELDITHDVSVSRPVNIKLENLYDWSPGNFIEDDEIQAFAQGSQQQLITDTLLKINELKQKRIKLKKVSKPSLEERKLFFKVQRLLKEVFIAKQVKSIPQIHSKSFPVLQANYTGSIPVVRVMQMRKKKYKK